MRHALITILALLSLHGGAALADPQPNPLDAGVASADAKPKMCKQSKEVEVACNDPGATPVTPPKRDTPKKKVVKKPPPKPELTDRIEVSRIDPLSVKCMAGGLTLTIKRGDAVINEEILCNGEDGKNGDKGPKGDTGPQGKQGDPGRAGDDGKSIWSRIQVGIGGRGNLTRSHDRPTGYGLAPEVFAQLGLDHDFQLFGGFSYAPTYGQSMSATLEFRWRPISRLWLGVGFQYQAWGLAANQATNQDILGLLGAQLIFVETEHLDLGIELDGTFGRDGYKYGQFGYGVSIFPSAAFKF